MAIAGHTQALESLARRPEAKAYKIEDLLAEVSSGRVRIPSFQRRLKWEREDARKLLDSLYRGYPVGTLLFWETQAKPGDMHFGLLTIHAGERSDALWVVDGQQRIVSLVRVLLAPEPDTDEFALYFDLDEGVFVAPPSSDLRNQTPARWLPMNAVGESDKLMQWAYTNAATDKERRERAFLLGKRIREYEIPAYLVRTDNDSTLREVFSRINSYGKRLNDFEVFDALNGSRTETRPTTLIEIASELETLYFGRVEEKILYRLLRVLQGGDVSGGRSKGPLRLDGQEAESAYRITVEAAGKAIEFFKNDAGIPHYELLPYKNPLVTLGKFFHHYPNPKPRSRDLLVRWLWRGALNGTHQGDNVSTRATLNRIVPDNEEQSVQRMLELVREKPTVWPDVGDPFNFRFATSKLQALALMDLGPRDFETGELLRLGGFLDNSTNDRKLPFPSLIASNHRADNGHVLSIANRLAHPSRTGLRKLLLHTTDSTILASHGIIEAAMQALSNGDVTSFLRLRAEYLRPYFQVFFNHHARWDEPDRPSLSALLVSDEAD